jgi:hypothetical protein
MTEKDLIQGQTYELKRSEIRKMFPNVEFCSSESPIISKQTHAMLYVPIEDDQLIKFKYDG